MRDVNEKKTRGASHDIPQEIWGVILFVGVVWGIFLLDRFTPLERLALVPRTTRGLIGIGTMAFLHHDWKHLMGNTIPLIVLLVLLAGSRARSWGIVLAIIVLGGSLLWVFGRHGNHLGASLLIFGLISFLIASGLVFERRPIPVLVALFVAFTYGITLLTGVLPSLSGGSDVSWDGHLCGALAGVAVAYLLTRNKTAAIA